MNRYLIVLLVAVGLAAVTLATPAISDDVAVEDAAGDGNGSVDLVSSTHGHGTVGSPEAFPGPGLGGSVLVHEIESSDDWSFDGDLVELRMTSQRWEKPRRLFVTANPDGSLTGAVFAGDRFRGYANVYAADASTLRVEFPESVLGRNVNAYDWRVFGIGTGADDTLPPDRLPDAGSVRHGGLWQFGP